MRLRDARLHMFLLVVTSGPAEQPRPVPLRDVELRGSLSKDRAMDITMSVMIATPIGRVPISGHIRGMISCDAHFSGEVTYGALVRVAAFLKGVDLVSGVDGHVRMGDEWSCVLAGTEVRGGAKVNDMLLTGWVAFGADSVSLEGPVWTVGDSVYHTDLRGIHRERAVHARVNMYDRGRR